jgi:hypothetical protein
MIFEPTLILMDEPLGALDKKLREQMQYEITRLHEQLGFTVIYVTHDQAEALSMSTASRSSTTGSSSNARRPPSFTSPANAFVADFIGENNFIPGKVEGSRAARGRVRSRWRARGARGGRRAARACAAGVDPAREAVHPCPTSHAYDNEFWRGSPTVSTWATSSATSSGCPTDGNRGEGAERPLRARVFRRAGSAGSSGSFQGLHRLPHCVKARVQGVTGTPNPSRADTRRYR